MTITEMRMLLRVPLEQWAEFLPLTRGYLANMGDTDVSQRPDLLEGMWKAVETRTNEIAQVVAVLVPLLEAKYAGVLEGRDSVRAWQKQFGHILNGGDNHGDGDATGEDATGEPCPGTPESEGSV